MIRRSCSCSTLELTALHPAAMSRVGKSAHSSLRWKLPPKFKLKHIMPSSLVNIFGWWLKQARDVQPSFSSPQRIKECELNCPSVTSESAMMAPPKMSAIGDSVWEILAFILFYCDNYETSADGGTNVSMLHGHIRTGYWLPCGHLKYCSKKQRTKLARKAFCMNQNTKIKLAERMTVT